MKIRTLLCATIVSLLLWPALAQSPPEPQPPAPNASVVLVGNPGPTIYYYWLIANYTMGQAPIAGPFVMLHAPNTLSGSNYVSVAPVYPAGASSVDLLRTTTPTAPSGACNCAVATGLTSGAISDQGNSLKAYTVNLAVLANLNLTRQNEVQDVGSSDLILRQNRKLVADLSSATGSSEINGARYASPEAAVAAACSSTKAVYFPTGTYPTAGIPACSNLHIRCASPTVVPGLGTGGTVFRLTGANWGLYNPNAGSGVANPSANEVVSLRVEGCTWDISHDSSALGAWHIEGILFSQFYGNYIYSNNNSNPAITESGANWQNNGGDYDNDFFGTYLYDNAGVSSTAIGIYVTGDSTGGSNNNKHFGGDIVRFGNPLKIDAGNNNLFVGIDAEDWNQKGVWITTNGPQAGSGNKVQDIRLESAATGSNTGIQIDSGANFNVIDHPYHSGSYTFMVDNGNNTCVHCLYGTPGAPLWTTYFTTPAINGGENFGIDKIPALPGGTRAGGLDIHGQLQLDNTFYAQGGASLKNNVDSDMTIPFQPGTGAGSPRNTILQFKSNLGARLFNEIVGPAGWQIYDGTDELIKINAITGGGTNINSASGNTAVCANCAKGSGTGGFIVGDGAGHNKFRMKSDGTFIWSLSGSNSGNFLSPDGGFTGARLFTWKDASGTVPLEQGEGTTGSIGGSALAAGACASGTLAISNATTAMVPKASPTTYPGDGFWWEVYVSAAGTVTVKVCAAVAGTPTSSTYNVRLFE